MNAVSPQMLTLTDAAADQVKKLIDDSDTPVIGLRVSVSSKGCSGLSYVFEYVEAVSYTHLTLPTILLV